MARRSPFAIAVVGAGVVVLAAVASLGLTHRRGADDAVVPLAIQRVDRLGMSGGYRLVVECADEIHVTVGADHGGSDLPEVTVWGRPKVGRCHPQDATLGPFALHGPKGPHDPPGPKIVDGATSQVVALPS